MTFVLLQKIFFVVNFCKRSGQKFFLQKELSTKIYTKSWSTLRNFHKTWCSLGTAAWILCRWLEVTNCASGSDAQWQFCSMGGVWFLPGSRTALSWCCFAKPWELVCASQSTQLQAMRLPPAKQGISQPFSCWRSSKCLPTELEVWQLPDETQDLCFQGRKHCFGLVNLYFGLFYSSGFNPLTVMPWLSMECGF